MSGAADFLITFVRALVFLFDVLLVIILYSGSLGTLAPVRILSDDARRKALFACATVLLFNAVLILK